MDVNDEGTLFQRLLSPSGYLQALTEFGDRRWRSVVHLAASVVARNGLSFQASG